MAQDLFQSYDPALLVSPPTVRFDITPNDADDLVAKTRAIWVGVGGDVKVDDGAGGVVTYSNVPTGSRLSGRFSRVYATGTTASGLIGEY